MKKNTYKKIIALMLIIAMCVPVFAGCGKKDDDIAVETPEFVYIPEYFKIDGEIQKINQVAYHDGVVYFTTWVYEESDGGGGVMPPLPQPFEAGDESLDDAGADAVDADTEADPEPTPAPATPPPMARVMSSSNVVVGSSRAMPRPMPMPAAPADDADATDDADIEDEDSGDEDSDATAPAPDDDKEIMYPDYNYGREVTKIFKVNIDGTGLEELKNFEQTQIPDGKVGSSNVGSMTVDKNGNIWIEERVNSYVVLDQDYNTAEETNEMLLRKLDNTGAEVSRIDTSAVVTDRYTYIQSMQIDEDGNVYFSVYSSTEDYSIQSYYVLVMDSNGKEIVKLESENWIDRLVKLGDGRIGVPQYGESGQVLRFVDLEKRDWGEEINLPRSISFYNAMPGDDEYDLYYNDNANYVGVKFGEEKAEITQILSWMNSDIDPNNIMVTAPLANGKIMCILQTWDRMTGESITEFAILEKRPYSELPEREIITLAAMYVDYNMRSDIIKFNKTSDKYRISVTEYEQYVDYESGGDDAYQQVLTRFNTEIISGKTPDIILLNSGMPVNQYAAKGLLADLYEFIDDDPDLNREDFVESVMKTLEYDGKLVQMISSFALSTYVGFADVLGPEKGITLDELMAAVDERPGSRPFDFYYTKENILSDCLSMNMNSFIDWSTGKCNFNSPEFIRILEFANRFPDSFDWESPDMEYPDSYADFRDGTQLLMQMWMSDFLNFMYNKQEFGDREIVFKGFPTETRDGHAMQISSSAFAITTKCKNKEGAWEFLRTYLTNEYQTGDYLWDYPINKKALEKKAEQAMTEEYYDDPFTGERIKQAKMSYWQEGSETPIEIYAMSKEDVDMIMDLINSITRARNYDDAIVKIIIEDATPFFKGQKTAEATADILQNRISLYVNEQR